MNISSKVLLVAGLFLFTPISSADMPGWPPCGPKGFKGPSVCPPGHPCKIHPEICELPAIVALDKAIADMDKQLRTHADSLPTVKKEKLLSLLDRQREQLEVAKKQTEQVSAAGVKQGPSKELADIFATGAEIKKLLIARKGTFKSAGYSPDPSQCANHCEKTCGYDSIGEKICWYSCYRCCGQGGC